MVYVSVSEHHISGDTVGFVIRSQESSEVRADVTEVLSGCGMSVQGSSQLPKVLLDFLSKAKLNC